MQSNISNNMALYNNCFSHIYVEKSISKNATTTRILKSFPAATIIWIDNYRDVFGRGKQSYNAQHKSCSLILARKEGNLIYKGAAVCQDFGNENFYYASPAIGCPYNCEYCYLKGMYASGNIVMFVNTEDFFAETDKLLSKHPAYICISYDTDLCAFEAVTGFVHEWSAFASTRRDLSIEIRTKCASLDFDSLPGPFPNVIYAFTISPRSIITRFEHQTPSLEERVSCIKRGLSKGYRIRLCFDPMIYCRDWKHEYSDMIDFLSKEISFKDISDVSIGSFRISGEYLRAMKKAMPTSEVVQFLFVKENNVCHYDDKLESEMQDFLFNKLKAFVPESIIYRLENDE